MALSKKQDEHHLKVLRELLKLPENRQCFDCPQRGPIYANMLNNTFVCEQCSGLHRELTHRIKSISASRFTFQEIQALRNGGNQKAAAIWMAKWDDKKDRVPAVSDAILMRKYLRHKYVERRWISDAHEHLYEPAPTARFLEKTSSSSSSLTKYYSKDDVAMRRIGSNPSDLSIGKLASSPPSSHGNVSDSGSRAIAIRQPGTPTSKNGPLKKIGIINVNSPHSVTVFDRYNPVEPNKVDQQRERSHSNASTRQSGYSGSSLVDDDDDDVRYRSAGGKGQRPTDLTVVTRQYLRDTRPANTASNLPENDRDGLARRGGRKELEYNGYGLEYSDEPVDEFFEIMRERVSGTRRPSSEASSIRSGGNNGNSLNNPFSKRSQGYDGSNLPSASSSDTYPSTAISTPDGQLITFAESPRSNRPELVRNMNAASVHSKSSLDSLHTQVVRPNIAALQNSNAAFQRSASMPVVPQIAFNNANINNGQHSPSFYPSNNCPPVNTMTPNDSSSIGQHGLQPLTIMTSGANPHGMRPGMAGNSWHGSLSTMGGPINGSNNPFISVSPVSNSRFNMASAPVTPTLDYNTNGNPNVTNSIYGYPQLSPQTVQSHTQPASPIAYPPRAATLPYASGNGGGANSNTTPTNAGQPNNNPFIFNHMRDALSGPTIPSNDSKIYAASPSSQPIYGQPWS